ADYRSQSHAWLFDIGSNSHVAPDSSSIRAFEPYYGEVFLHVGNDAYISRAKEYVDALANIGEAFKEKDLVMLEIAGLRKDYNGLKSTLLARQAPTAFHELQGLLADHDYMIKQSVPVIPSQTGSSPQVFTTTTSGTSSQTGSSQQDPVQALTQLASQLGFNLQPFTQQAQAFNTSYSQNKRGRGRTTNNRGRGGCQNNQTNKGQFN
nr:hypothetical protein CTI12_AA517590 [Tanacetum cinerariifolium]